MGIAKGTHLKHDPQAVEEDCLFLIKHGVPYHEAVKRLGFPSSRWFYSWTCRNNLKYLSERLQQNSVRLNLSVEGKILIEGQRNEKFTKEVTADMDS